MLPTAAASPATAASPAPTAFAAPLAPAPGQQILVRMRESADLSQEALLPRGAERRTAVWNDLVATADRTQQSVQGMLDKLSASGDVLATRSIPVANAIVVTTRVGADAAVAAALEGVAEIGSVLRNQGARGIMPAAAPIQAATGAAHITPVPTTAAASLPHAATSGPRVAWGVQRIGAEAAWAKGYTGAGVTVGIIDSGVDIAHPALASRYRGGSADGTITNDYNWLDTSGFATGVFAPKPSDSGSHGTHVMGSILGGTDADAIGVAPDAKFIAARMVFGDHIQSTISSLDALSFMLAPTKVDGSAPDPTRGADVVNNSWGASDWESRESQGAFDALKAAGILLVNSAGNDGRSSAGRVSAPGAYPGHLSIASSDSRDKGSSFSSPGPSAFDPNGILPNITAPGSGIYSSVPGGRYGEKDGTSMAAPHVTGAVALMLQAKPDATYDQIRAALESTALDIGAPGPDLKTGYGRINVDAAIDKLLADA